VPVFWSGVVELAAGPLLPPPPPLLPLPLPPVANCLFLSSSRKAT